MYRDFVLSPWVEPGRVEAGWRRTLWEYFWPRVQRSATPDAAARIVVRELRTRVAVGSIAPGGNGIGDAWRQRCTDERGFEALYVAALRAVGIAARRAESGTIELWRDNRWIPAPVPPLVLPRPEPLH